MRVFASAAAAVLMLAAAVGLDSAASAASTTAPAPTIRTVVRPVTSTGHVRAGYILRAEPTGQVDCSFPDPSPGAVNRNIEFCSPSAEYAIACWKAAAAHRVLCMRDPRSKRVVRIPRVGAFAPTAPAPRRERGPLVIVLGNGDRCSIRDGGAWGTLASHPTWVGTYSCGAGVVWAPPDAAHQGVNESAASWTVRVGSADGTGALVTRHVRRAFFVGTFFG